MAVILQASSTKPDKIALVVSALSRSLKLLNFHGYI